MAITLIEKTWAAQDLAAVSALQNVAAPGSLLLNGTYYSSSSSTIRFIDQGFARNVSLTSTNNLSAANFTVSGVQNSTVVSEVIAGPNNNTVTTTAVFDIISSITVDAAVNGIRVGTGLSGYFSIVPRDNSSLLTYRTPVLSYALGFVTQGANGCTYQIYQSLVDLQNNGETYAAMVADSSFISVHAAYVNITQILQNTDVCRNILVSVTSALNTSTLKMKFLQFT